MFNWNSPRSFHPLRVGQGCPRLALKKRGRVDHGKPV